MSEYSLNIMGDIKLSDYSSIHDYLGVVGINDKLIITLEDDNNKNIEAIGKLLQDNHFYVDLNKEGKKYFISCIRYKC